MQLAADRLVHVHNVRVFELWLAQVASDVKTPCLAWASATVAVVRPEQSAIVIVLVGLRRRAWFALGALHGLAWLRMRRALGRERSGYRIRIWVV